MRTSASDLAERLRRKQFERMVRKAIDSLPAAIGSLMVNVEIVIEDEPTDEQRGDEEDGPLGLYEGIPLTERTSSYGMILPDKITIFRRPLEDACASEDEMAEEVRVTVLHELAHHLGFDEDRIDELGLG